ncbi:type I-E CRISPR-associated protein Cse1/CasA [Candidatus Foliamicus sp.]
MDNLLVDPLIRVRVNGGDEECLSLPSLFVALADDRVVEYPALRPHQRHAWHAFLAQLAVISIHRGDNSSAPRSASEWISTLRGLTPGFDADEPWRLVVEDASLPAFMQPPAPDSAKDYRKLVEAPDDLDLLVTSKNHDVKQSVAWAGDTEDWIFALVNLQTMAGFQGAGNYGIARMNGGFSSRPCLGLAPAEGNVGAHLFTDVERMLADRKGLLDRMAQYFQTEGGLALLWLEPWDGSTSLDLRILDPHFIEVCRRVRLLRENNKLAARTATSRKPRIEAKAAKGDLGDFWTPVSAKESKALSLPASGFTYKRLSELLFDKGAFDPPAAMRTSQSRHGAWRVVARAIAGGQGKTDGYHERTDIRFSPEVAGLLSGSAKRDELAKLSRRQIEEIDAVSGALRFAIATAASGGKSPTELTKSDRSRAIPFIRRLELEADKQFFKFLEKRYLAVDDKDQQDLRSRYVNSLIGVARDLLKQSIQAIPFPAIRRHRARARAFAALDGALWRAKSGPLADLMEAPRIRGKVP